MMRLAPAGLLLLALLAGCFPPEPRDRDPRWADPPIVTFPRKEPRDAPPATAPLLPAAASSFEDFLNLPESRMDPALGALLFAAEDIPDFPMEPFLRAVDDMARTIRERAGGERGADVLDHINQYLYFDEGYRYDPQDPTGVVPDNLYLHRVIRRKRGYCVSLGVLYLAIGRRLGLPLYGVRIPSHFIVRYDDGKVRRNVETTDFGIPHPDSYYAEKYRIAEESVRRGVYLRNLGLRQVFADLLNNRGTLRGVSGDWAGALKALDRGLALDPGSPYLHYNRGVLLTRTGREAEAEAAFARALDLDPRHFYAINNLAEIHANRGEFDRALEEVNRALEIHPDYSNGYLNRGAILQRMGKADAAAKNIDRAIEADPKNGLAYVFRARVFREKRDFLHAIHDLNRAVAADPHEPQAWAERGYTYLAMDRADKALPDFDKAVELAPGMIEVRLNRGVARLKSGDRGGARADFDRAAADGPDRPEPLLNRAVLALVEKRWADAVADLDRALALRPDQPMALVKRGLAHLGLGRAGEAEADLLKAESLSPDLAEAHKHLGALYRDLGNRDRARLHLKRFLALEKGDDPQGRARARAMLEELEK
ncbi:MAG: tetratricopeptide repeat protein [Planctomycetes bacterium]|jgi:regulator of sirC expression with transglutaminase-like and TPR domain|nr:tetratricopeptide repeat protein [Planctomycetota bacterium]